MDTSFGELRRVDGLDGSAIPMKKHTTRIGSREPRQESFSCSELWSTRTVSEHHTSFLNIFFPNHQQRASSSSFAKLARGQLWRLIYILFIIAILSANNTTSRLPSIGLVSMATASSFNTYGSLDMLKQAQKSLDDVFQAQGCMMPYNDYNELTQLHDYILTANIYGTWRMFSSNTTAVRATQGKDWRPCTDYLEVTMVAATANVMRETLFGLSLDLIYNNTVYKTNLWGVSYQRFYTSFFEMYSQVNDSSGTISIKEQQLLVEGNVTNVQPANSDQVLHNTLIRKKFFGTNVVLNVKIQDLLAIYISSSGGNVNLSTLPTLPQLIAENAPTRLKLSILGLRYSTPLTFPLTDNIAIGSNAVFFSKEISISKTYQNPSLVVQNGTVTANYILSLIAIIINSIFAGLVLGLLIYFRNVQPRKSRGPIPYLVLFQTTLFLTRMGVQSFNGEDFVLIIFLFLSMGALAFAYILYFLNTLLFFYKRKVYHAVYLKLKRDSFEAKKDTEMVQDSFNTRKTTDETIDVAVEKTGSRSEYSKVPSLHWAKSKKVKAVAITLSVIVVIVVYACLIPIAIKTSIVTFTMVLQIILGLLIALSFLLIVLSFVVDLAWSWRTLFQKCQWKKYFFKNDSLYYRFELVLYIASVILFLITAIVKLLTMAKTDDLPLLESEEYANSIRLATFLVIPLEFLATFVEILAAGGGFICFATLYERIRLSNQCAEGLDAFFKKSNYLPEDIDKINFTRNKKKTPFLDLLGEDLTALFMDESGFDLLRRYSRSEFSVENLALLNDFEKVYAILYQEARSPTTPGVHRVPTLVDGIKSTDLQRARILLCENIYQTYVSDSCEMPVNFSNLSHGLFKEWVALKEDAWTEQYLKSEQFIADFEYVIVDVVKNIKDTFRRLMLTSEYRDWLKGFKENIVKQANKQH